MPTPVNSAGQPAHEPYLCIYPVCSPECSGCNCAISPNEMRKNAIRYALLQRRDPRFGMPTDWLKYDTLDEAIDSELEAYPRRTGETQ